MDLGVQVEPQFGFSYEAVRDIARGAHAAKWADWFNMSNPGTDETERIPMLRDGIHAACKAVGRDPSTLRTSIFVLGCVAATRAELDQLIPELAAGAKAAPEQWPQPHAGAIGGTTDGAGARLGAI